MKYNNMLLCMAALLFCSIGQQGPEPVIIRTAGVLASALADERLKGQQLQTGFLADNPLFLPWLDELELRYGPDDLYLNEQRIAVRIDNNGWQTIKKQEQVHELELALLSAEQRVLLQEGLMERYETLCDLYFLQALRQQQRQLAQLYDTTRQAYRFLLSVGAKADLVDLIEAEEDSYAALANLRELDGEYQLALSRLSRWQPMEAQAEVRLDTFITAEQMAAVAAAIAAQTQQAPTPDLVIREIDTRLAQAQWQLEKSKQYNILTFFQVDYRQPNEPFVLQRDLSARIGLKVPLPGSARIKQREQALEVLQSQHRYQWAQRAHQQEVALQVQKLNNLLAQQASLLADHRQNQLHRLLDDPLAEANLEATDVLRLRLLRQRQKISQLEMAYQTSRAYLVLLDISGAASAQPLRNYLDPRLGGL